MTDLPADSYTAYCSACRLDRLWRLVARIGRQAFYHCAVCGKERVWLRR